MTRFHLLPLLLLILLAAGCSDSPARRSLDHAEAIMESHPDSALSILETVDPAELHSERSSARYALLYSQALDKNYIDLTDDSLICVAERYYEDKDDLRPLMLSYFYHGRVKENAGDLPQSLRLYIKSLECARLLGDDFWTGRVSTQIGLLYFDTDHNTEYLHYSTEAYEHLREAGRQNYINYALYDLARATFMDRDYDKAITLSEEVRDSALKYSDISLAAASDGIKAKALYFKRDYGQAIAVYEKLIDEGLMTDGRYAILGLCYLATDNMEKLKAIPMPTDSVCSQEIDALLFRYELAEKNHDKDRAQEIYGQMVAMNDSVLSVSLDQNFGEVLSELYSQERALRDLERKNHRNILILILLTVTIIVLLLLYRHKRQSEMMDRKIAMASNLEELLETKEKDLDASQQSIRNLFADKYEFISQLFDFYYSNSASKSLKKKIAEEVDSIIEDFSNNEQRIVALEASVDETFDGLVASFKKDFPDLRQADRLLFLYTVLGFSHNAIALILKEEKMTAVYNRKRRLKDKIKALDPIKAERYLNYFN